MRYLQLVIFLIAFTFRPLSASCNDTFGGLVFRAYEYSKDERTSLIIPAPGQHLKFRKYLSLSFDLKIRQQGEHFGYVCRMIIGNQSDINLILINPVNEDPYLCFIKDKQYLGSISPDKKIDIYNWNRMEIELEIRNDSLYVKGNGVVIARDERAPENRSVSIYFGANDVAQFATSDVAPMILRNVEVGLGPAGADHVWPLVNPAPGALLKDERSGLAASVVNPEWSISRHLHWNHIRKIRFASKTYPVPDGASGAFYFVSQNSVTRLDLSSQAVSEYPVSPSVDVDRLTNQFIVIPGGAKGNRLVHYDFEKPDGENLSFFDLETQNWSAPIKRSRQSGYSQHNKLFSGRDSSVIQLFGYGFHTYIPEMNRVSLSGKAVREKLPETIPPRYLSSIGVTGDSVYIYGGMGNELGKQEYGVNYYRDLYLLDLRDYSIQKLWEVSSGTYNEVAAPSLIVDSLREHAKGLFFTPLRFQSGLVMKDLDINTGELTALGDTIPFTFLDVSSFVEFMYMPAQQLYYAVTVHQADAHYYEANVYSIAYPVFAIPADASGKTDWLLTGIGAAAVIALGGAALALGRRGRRMPVAGTAEEYPEGEEKADGPDLPAGKVKLPRPDMKPGIHLLNGFQVIDRHSKDITGRFTPIMRQLLSVIILYTHRNNKGISNTRLKELFWLDKSEESFSNNRSVNMRKIRLLLEEIGDMEISSENGYWCVANKGHVYMDYVTVTELIRKLTPLAAVEDRDLNDLLRLASFGQLLPNMQFDWLDGFKADYSDSMINLLSKLRDSEQFRHKDKTKIAIANCILRFDSLDEDSIRVKCLSLVNLKRTGLAYATFEQFTKEYKLILNETYKHSFEDICGGVE